MMVADKTSVVCRPKVPAIHAFVAAVVTEPWWSKPAISHNQKKEKEGGGVREKETVFSHHRRPRRVTHVCHAPPMKVSFTSFFLSLPPTYADLHNHRKSTRKPPSLKVCVPTRRRLSGALDAWAASLDSVLGDLHGDGVRSHRVGADRRLWALLAPVGAAAKHHLGVI